MHLLRSTDYIAATRAGLITGVVFLILVMIMIPVFLDGSPWAPPRMMAAILLGEEVAPPPGSFNWKIFLAAMVVHLPGSILLMTTGAFIIDRMSFVPVLLTGNALGFLLYWIGFFLITDVWPWFEKSWNWVSLVTHLSFGLVGALGLLQDPGQELIEVKNRFKEVKNI